MQTGVTRSTEQDDAIFFECVKALFGYAPRALIAGTVIAGVTAVTLWNISPEPLLWPWFFCILLMTIVRGIYYRKFMLANHSDKRDNAIRWAHGYTAGVVISGILWGALPWIALDLTSVSNTLVICIVIFGMMAASIGSHATYLPAFASFLLIAGGMLVLRFFVESQAALMIGLMITTLVVINLSYAINLGRIFRGTIARDFEREQLLHELEEKKNKAENASRDKSRFLAAVSHDLRQPLHALSLFHASLKASLEKEDQKNLLALADQSSRALGEMLGELLDIARLDAGKIKPDPCRFPLASLLGECAEGMQPLADEQGLKFRLRLPRKGCVKSDPVLLKRILRNLLANAIRYTESGGVLLGTRRRDDDVHIEVYDTGVGIPEESLPHIFDEFYQINNPERDREKGLGLGLSIVRRMADTLGHRIHVRSRPGSGSCFSIIVPLYSEMEAYPQETDAPRMDMDVAGLFVIVVDDDRAILQGMRELLLGWGCEVLLAESEADLLGELKEHKYPPADVLISDYRLRGGHTGLEVSKAVEAHFAREIPTLITSGDVSPEVQTGVREAGYHWLEKPVQDDVLKGMIAELGDFKA